MLNLIKRQLRAAEKTWRKLNTQEHLNSFKQISYNYRRMIKKARHYYYTIISAGNNYKKLFKISKSLLGRTTHRILPDCIPSINATNFDNYFNNKIHRIINSLPKPILQPLTLQTYSLNSFYTTSTASIDKLLLAVKSSCMLDPIPTLLLHTLSSFLSPFYKSIIENSLLTGVVTLHEIGTHYSHNKKFLQR